MALTGGGTALVHQRHRPSDETLGELVRIGNGGGAADELGMGAVEFAEAQKTPDHISQV